MIRRALPLWLTYALLLPWASAAQEPAESPGALDEALAEVRSGHIDEAITRLETSLADGAGDPRLSAMLGTLYLQQDRADEALDILAPLADDEDADPAVLYNAGRSALALGDSSHARDYLQRSVDAAPNTPATRALGLLHSRQHRPLAAYLLLKPWTDLHPDDAEARQAAAACAVRLGRAAEAEQLLTDLPTDEPEMKVLWGKLLLLKGDAFSALAMVRPFQDDPPSAVEEDVRAVLADAYLALEQPGQARAVLEGKTGEDSRLAWRLSEALYRDGDLDAAIASIEPLARGLLDGSSVTPPDSQLIIQYGRLLALAERNEEAVVALRRATELSPGSTLAWKTLGEALRGAGDGSSEAEAEAALARAAELAQNTGSARTDDGEPGGEAVDATARELRRAQRLLAEDRTAEAISFARQEQVLNPRDTRPYLVEAQMLLLLERYDEALAAVDGAIAVAPESIDAAYYRGVVQAASGNLAAAETTFRRVLERAPDHVPTLSDLALLLATNGRRAEADELAQRLLQLRPDDPAVRQVVEQVRAD